MQTTTFDHCHRSVSSEGRAHSKRARRTKGDMEDLLKGILTILGEYNERVSIRHLFYRCANAGLIDKTENAYNSLRGHLSKWRRAKIIPYSKFVDGTRWHYGADVFNSLGEYLNHAASSYRLNLWETSDYYPEVWVEKEAIAAMVSRIVQHWNIKVFVGRGDASMSALADAGETFNYYRKAGKIPIILYLGDYDETGLAIPKTIQNNLMKDHDCEVELRRVTVNREHIFQYDLPTRPPKGKRRGEEIDMAVDIDAMPPAMIRELLEQQIHKLIDHDEFARLKNIEAMEQETLKNLSL
jgi:hypothetical protein